MKIRIGKIYDVYCSNVSEYLKCNQKMGKINSIRFGIQRSERERERLTKIWANWRGSDIKELVNFIRREGKIWFQRGGYDFRCNTVYRPLEITLPCLCFRSSSPGTSKSKDGPKGGREQQKSAHKERKEDLKQKEPVQFAIPKNQVGKRHFASLFPVMWIRIRIMDLLNPDQYQKSAKKVPKI